MPRKKSIIRLFAVVELVLLFASSQSLAAATSGANPNLGAGAHPNYQLTSGNQPTEKHPSGLASGSAFGWLEVGSGSATGGGISNNPGASSRPVLAFAPDGSIYVDWDDNSSGNSEIYIKQWKGLGWTSVGPNSASGGGVSNNSGDSYNPALSVDLAGVPYVAWDDYSHGSEVYIRRWHNGSWEEIGSGSATGGGISNNSADFNIAADIAVTTTPYVAWQSLSAATGQHFDIYLKRWNGSSWVEMPTGSASGGGISNNPGDSWRPELALAPDSSIYIAWDDNSSGNSEIYVRHWNGTSWEEVGPGSATGGGISNNSGQSIAASIAVAPDGKVYVAWQDGTSGDNEIYVRRWNGSSWEEVGSGSASGGGISNNFGDSVAPSLALASDGTPYVAWQDATSGNIEIYVRRWNGSSWEEAGPGSATNGGISGTPGNSYLPSIAIGPDNKPYVAWADNSGGNYDIYARYWTGTVPTSFLSLPLIIR